MSHTESQAQAPDPNANLAQVDREFAYANPIEKYVDARRPEYKGTIGGIGEAGGEVTPESAPDGSTAVDSQGRAIIKRNGKWVLQ